jgi:hypothetical protein
MVNFLEELKEVLTLFMGNRNQRWIIQTVSKMADLNVVNNKEITQNPMYENLYTKYFELHS